MASTRIFRSLSACIIALTGVLLATSVAAQSPAPLPNPNLNLLTNGTVYAIARQPDGGVVFGGSFSSFNGVTRANIARLLPNGELDLDWNPTANGSVRALAVNEFGAVYVGGRFTSIGNQSRNFLAKLSATSTGSVDENWNPAPNSYVYALAVDSSGTVYAGGLFGSIGGMSRSHVAKLSGIETGAADPTWNPLTVGGQFSEVLALALGGNRSIYVGGYFSSIGGQSRRNIAKMETTGVGEVDVNWNPSADNKVSALAVDNSGAVYAGGGFISVGALPRTYIAKLSGSGTGEVDANWIPSANAGVSALAIDIDGAVYAGGYFTSIGKQSRNRLAKLSGSGTGEADLSWNPSVNKGVFALASGSDGAVYAGGEFTVIGGLSRLGFAVVDDAGNSGAMTDVEHSTATAAAFAVQPEGGMIVGGHFLKANGLARSNLLRLNQDGTLDAEWSPSADARVSALATDSQGSVYVGGYFSNIDGQPRSHIAKLSGSGTGLVDEQWNPSADARVSSLAVDGNDAVYAAGEFRSIGTQSRNYIAKLLNNSVGTVDAHWNPSASGLVYAVAVDSNGAVYAGGSFASIGGRQRTYLAKLSSSDIGAADSDWNPAPNASVQAITVDSNGAIYAGGHFTVIGGQPRSRIAKLSGSDIGTADATWDPSSNGTVNALAADNNGSVYAAGNFNIIGNQSINWIAKLSDSGIGEADVTWNPSPDSHVTTLTLGSNGAVYVAGNFSSIGGRALRALAALPSNESTHIFADSYE